MTDPTMGVRDVLRIRDYRHLFGGQIVSDIGDGITLLLVLLVINDLTGGTTMRGADGHRRGRAGFTVGLVAGVYVDRWDRRRIMLAADLLRAVVVLAFGLVQSPALRPAPVRPRVRPGLDRDVLPSGARRDASAHRPGRGPSGSELAGAGLPGYRRRGGAGIAGLLFGMFGSGIVGFAIDSATFLASFVLIAGISRSAGRIDVAPPRRPAAGRRLVGAARGFVSFATPASWRASSCRSASRCSAWAR